MPKIRAATVAEQRANTEARLIAAVEQLVADGTFGSAPIGDIAAAAGIGRTGVYRYAPDKDGLLELALGRSAARARQQILDRTSPAEGPIVEQIEVAIRIVLLGAADDARRLALLAAAKERLSSARFDAVLAGHQAEVRERFLSLLRGGLVSGELRYVGSESTMLAFVLGVLDTAIQIATEEPDRAAASADEAARFVLAALKAR